MTVRFKLPIAYAIGATNAAGNILPGTQLRFYNTGGTTPRTVYSDKDLSNAISQPIAADSAGRFPDIYMQSGLFKVRWETSAGVEIDTWDDVDPGLATGGSGGILAVVDGGTGASTAGGALTNLGAASQSGLDTAVANTTALAVRVTTLENASAFVTPGGRLTLTTAVPVLTSDVTAATTVYYTPYIHNRVPLWDGSAWTLTEVDEVSQTLADTTKSPAAATTSSNYDMFVWDDEGTVRCTRGPAWDDLTTRGTGAGKTELVRVDGFLMNAQNITNGPDAQRGLYVGTISTNASTQLAMMFLPDAAAGGSANRLDVWNMYNRVDISSVCRDSTNSWTDATTGWEALNASTSNRITFVIGLLEDRINARVQVSATVTAGIQYAGIGMDVTNAIVAGSTPGRSVGSGSASLADMISEFRGIPSTPGSHFVQALQNVSTATTTFLGDNNDATLTQEALVFTARM